MAREPFAAKLTCIWIGAAFYFALKGFKGTIKQQIDSKYYKRNFWTGYTVTVLSLGLLVWLVI